METNRCKHCNTEVCYIRCEYKDPTPIVKCIFYCTHCEKNIEIFYNYKTLMRTVYYK
jgi:hypothetical protein